MAVIHLARRDDLSRTGSHPSIPRARARLARMRVRASWRAWRRARPLRTLGVVACLAAVLAGAPIASAQSPVEQARALLSNYREDLSRIDRARDLLESTVGRDG